MPELPEVETIRRQLQPFIANKVLQQLVVRTPQLLQNTQPEQVQHHLVGKRLHRLVRIGKFLIFDFAPSALVFHLGMSGIFFLKKEQASHPEHIHLIFRFENGVQVFYQDVRKFGKVWFYPRSSDFQPPGVDPFSEKFTLNNFKKFLNLKKMNVKAFLMDQHYVSGIGNIYANEILHRAGISPLQRIHELKSEEVRQLYFAIREVLSEAIEHFGTTYSAYRTVEGATGEHQNFLRVYHREGKLCLRCGVPIIKIVLHSRSTFYCPECQK